MTSSSNSLPNCSRLKLFESLPQLTSSSISQLGQLLTLGKVVPKSVQWTSRRRLSVWTQPWLGWRITRRSSLAVCSTSSSLPPSWTSWCLPALRERCQINSLRWVNQLTIKTHLKTVIHRNRPLATSMVVLSTVSMRGTTGLLVGMKAAMPTMTKSIEVNLISTEPECCLKSYQLTNYFKWLFSCTKVVSLTNSFFIDNNCE